MLPRFSSSAAKQKIVEIKNTKTVPDFKTETDFTNYDMNTIKQFIENNSIPLYKTTLTDTYKFKSKYITTTVDIYLYIISVGEDFIYVIPLGEIYGDTWLSKIGTNLKGAKYGYIYKIGTTSWINSKMLKDFWNSLEFSEKANSEPSAEEVPSAKGGRRGKKTMVRKNRKIRKTHKRNRFYMF
jgi:hypothetical protein